MNSDVPRLTALELCHAGMMGVTASDAIAACIELAPLLEAYGYERYWFAEHHEATSGHSSPEILIAAIAGVTDQIRVGSAGILLRYYDPMKVAKTFCLLEHLYPGRIDLGVVRGASSDRATHGRLTCDGRVGEYEAKVTELALWLGANRSRINPVGETGPNPWLLGSNAGTARLAASVGAGFCLGLSSHEVRDRPEDVLRAYLDAHHDARSPRLAIALAGVCAETDDEAQLLASRAVPIYRPTVVGTPQRCAAIVKEASDRYGVGDVVFVDMCWQLSDRQRSYRLLAQSLKER